MKKLVLGLIVAVWALLGGATIAAAQGFEAAYQRDADAKRINDVHEIAELIEAYKVATGHYPYSDKARGPGEQAMPVLVRVNMPSADKTLGRRPNPFSLRAFDVVGAELIKILSGGLGRPVSLPVDPQKVPIAGPNAYYVSFPSTGGFIAMAFLYEPNAHTNPLAKHVNLYTVSSGPMASHMSGQLLKLRPVDSVPAEERAKIAAEGKRTNAVFARFSTIAIP